jgi:DDE family transposase
VCHLPPGTSKWNKIEHRLFSHISLNWRGRPLTSHEVIVETIAATTTRTGLRVNAQLDTGTYPTGIRISDAQMAALPIIRHDFHSDWNYTLHPSPPDTGPAGQPCNPVGTPDPPNPADLAHPDLTGLSHQELDQLVAALQPLHRTEIGNRQFQRRTAAGKKPHAPRPGRPVRLVFAHRVLATVLHLRLQLSPETLAPLFSISSSAIRRAIADTKVLLQQHATTIEPVAPPTSPTDLLNMIKKTRSTPEIKPAC